jgi:hypothetical protein
MSKGLRRSRSAGGFFVLKDRGSGVPPAAPGSGCGSVTQQTTLRNGGEPRQTAGGSRRFALASLTRGWCRRPRGWAPSPPGPLSPASGRKGESCTASSPSAPCTDRGRTAPPSFTPVPPVMRGVPPAGGLNGSGAHGGSRGSRGCPFSSPARAPSPFRNAVASRKHSRIVQSTRTPGASARFLVAVVQVYFWEEFAWFSGIGFPAWNTRCPCTGFRESSSRPHPYI